MSSPKVVPVTKPFSLKTASVLFKKGEQIYDFSSHISAISGTPSFTTSTFQPVNSRTLNFVSVPTWVIDLTGIQDLEENSFHRWLMANHGEKAQMLATFLDGTDPILADVCLVTPGWGGSTGADPLTSDISLPVDGQAVFKKGAALS